MSIADIELEYSLGNHDKARKMLNRYLRQNPDSADAWNLLRDLAETPADKERADANLRRLREGAWGSTNDEWGEPAAAASGSGGSFAMGSGTSISTATDYRPHAIGSVIAMLFFSPIVGAVLAFVFMQQADNAQAGGQRIENRGCLQQALVANLAFMGFSLVVLCGLLAFGLLVN